MNAQVATKERQSASVADFASSQSKGGLAVVPPAEQFNPATPRSYPPKIAKALMAITREFGAIKKDGWNEFHKYHYQKWEDVLERESDLLAEHGIIVQQSETARSLLDKLISITYEFTIINEDGDAWPDRPVWTAIARLQDHKGMFDDKAANKCHTQAHKYFLLHFFKIKTKEAVDEDADSDVPDKQTAAPKPPKPGSAEAKALEGPRAITGTGPKPDDWATAFVAAIEKAETTAEIDRWIELNTDTLDRIANFRAENEKVDKAIKARIAALAPGKPKPPRPAAAAPKAVPMPDPTTDAKAWLEWLATKFEDFKSYEEGENYWNETIEPTLDGLPQLTVEDAMGVWRKFENIWAP